MYQYLNLSELFHLHHESKLNVHHLHHIKISPHKFLQSPCHQTFANSHISGSLLVVFNTAHIVMDDALHHPNAVNATFILLDALIGVCHISV